MNNFELRHPLAITVLSFSLAACASVGEPPRTLLAEVESEIKYAHELGAEEHAPLAYRSAQDHLAEAKRAIKEEDFQKATFLLEKSLVDTELAASKTQAEKSEMAASEVKESLNALKKSL